MKRRTFTALAGAFAFAGKLLGFGGSKPNPHIGPLNVDWCPQWYREYAKLRASVEWNGKSPEGWSRHSCSITGHVSDEALKNLKTPEEIIEEFRVIHFPTPERLAEIKKSKEQNVIPDLYVLKDAGSGFVWRPVDSK